MFLNVYLIFCFDISYVPGFFFPIYVWAPGHERPFSKMIAPKAVGAIHMNRWIDRNQICYVFLVI